MKKNQKQKLIFVIGLLIIISAVIIIKREKNSYQSPYRIVKLPNFEALDISGRRVKISDFKGKNLYVQFINSRFPADLSLFEAVHSKWINEGLYFLGIISDSTILDSKSRFNTEKVIFIEGDYYDLCSKFNINANNGFYFLADKKGIVINSGKNDLGYERGPKVFLQELIKGDSFSISELIRENENIDDFKWFSQVSDLIKNQKNKEYFIISLFTKICDSCSGGGTIKALEEIDRRDKKESIYILSILNRKFGSEDILNLKSQLKIAFPVIIADNELNIRWDSLIKRYREDFLTDIIFLVDKSGKIIKVTHRTCKCRPCFFDFVFSLIEEEK